MANTFDFVGKIVKQKNLTIEDKEFPSGWIKKDVPFSVVCGNNSQFVTIKSGSWKDPSRNKVYTFAKSTNNEQTSEKMVVEWANRFDPTVVSSVAHFKKYVLDLTSPETDATLDKVEFISPWDFAEEVKKRLANNSFDGMLFRVQGEIDFSYNAEKDIFYRDFVVKTIKRVPKDAEQYSKGSVDLFFAKNCIDEEFESENGYSKLIAYTSYYDTFLKKTSFAKFPVNLYSNVEKDVVFKNMIKDSVKSDAVQHCVFEVSFIHGAPKVEITDAELFELMDEKQKNLVRIEAATLDQMRETLAESINDKDVKTETRIIGLAKASLRAGGPVDTACTVEELNARPINNFAKPAETQEKNVQNPAPVKIEPVKTAEDIDIFDDI